MLADLQIPIDDCKYSLFITVLVIKNDAIIKKFKTVANAVKWKLSQEDADTYRIIKVYGHWEEL